MKIDRLRARDTAWPTHLKSSIAELLQRPIPAMWTHNPTHSQHPPLFIQHLCKTLPMPTAQTSPKLPPTIASTAYPANPCITSHQLSACTRHLTICRFCQLPPPSASCSSRAAHLTRLLPTFPTCGSSVHIVALGGIQYIHSCEYCRYTLLLCLVMLCIARFCSAWCCVVLELAEPPFWTALICHVTLSALLCAALLWGCFIFTLQHCYSLFF